MLKHEEPVNLFKKTYKVSKDITSWSTLKVYTSKWKMTETGHG